MFTLDFVRAINASKKFKIANEFEFVGFTDMSKEASTDEDPDMDHIEIWAEVKIAHNGEIPESYKALNLIIGDWVETHEEELTDAIHAKLKEHLAKEYPESEIDIDGETSIWADQLDYMPRVNEKEGSMNIELELVLSAEPQEDD